MARFWLRHGVDGFRVDAVPYIFERKGTSCENLPGRTPSSNRFAPGLTVNSLAESCSLAPTGGPRMSLPTLEMAANAAWDSSSRSCLASSWRSGRDALTTSPTRCGGPLPFQINVSRAPK